LYLILPAVIADILFCDHLLYFHQD